MAINETDAGRSYPPTAPYEVSAAKIAEFATAIGDAHPAYQGEAAVAPPTFVAVISSAAWGSMFDDQELGLALRRIVHGDQRFDHREPLRAGDVVTAALRIDRVRARGGSEMITASAQITDADGAERGTATATFVHTRAAS